MGPPGATKLHRSLTLQTSPTSASPLLTSYGSAAISPLYQVQHTRAFMGFAVDLRTALRLR